MVKLGHWGKTWRYYLLLALGVVLAIAIPLLPAFSQVSRKTIIVATEPTFPPFEMTDEATGQLTGFDVDLIKAIGEAAQVTVDIQGYPFDGIIPALQSNTVGAAISAITITPERAQSVSFSSPYFKSVLAIAVQDGNDTVKSIKDLEGKRLAVAIGTTGAMVATNVPGAKVTNFDSITSALQELVNGNADAVINDRPVLLYAIKDAGLKNVKISADVGSEDYYGIAMPLAPPGEINPTREVLNQGLFQIIENGTYNAIYDKWFGEKNPPFLPLVAPSLVGKVGTAQTLTERSQANPNDNFLITLFRNLFKGSILTVLLTAFSVFFGLIGGTGVAIALISDIKPLQLLFRIYVEFFRGTPMLVQLFIIYFGLPALFKEIGLGITIDRFPAAIIALSLNVAAYLAEIIRGGIQSIDQGQWEASESLGMSPWQTMKEVIFPQAFRRILPPLGNEFITLIKDTSLTAVIGFQELFREGQLIVATTYRAFEVYIAVALVYLLLTTISSFVFKWLENYMDPIGRAKKKAKAATA